MLRMQHQIIRSFRAQRQSLRLFGSVSDTNDSVGGLTHLKKTGDAVILPRMVDVSQKNETVRVATAKVEYCLFFF